ncbi:hypothetical protein ACFFVB_15830 [Formosa undariae]|uniref:Uncharacterized protein n=1 Tax=Formosa undariae TaxID=1325436 RepID=A0ABV5F574_9FLAO
METLSYKTLIIDSQAEFVIGKKLNELYDLLSIHFNENSLEHLKAMKYISAFIGFKDDEMNRLAIHN